MSLAFTIALGVAGGLEAVKQASEARACLDEVRAAHGRIVGSATKPYPPDLEKRSMASRWRLSLSLSRPTFPAEFVRR
jgi:hypothetical protein